MASVEVFWGDEPEHQSEREFLAQLRANFEDRQLDALILANFHIGGLQFDFLIVQPGDRLCHVELKHYPQPLVGGENGPWKARQADGSLQDLQGTNPYTQAARQRFALSDEFQSFAEETAGVPRAPSKHFYHWFDSVVCIFPALAEGSTVPSNFKVRTLGYKDMLDLVTNSTSRFPWNRECWLKFVKYLGLTSANPTPKAAITSSEAQAVIKSYRQAFADFYSRDLHELVPTPIFSDDLEISTPDLPPLLQRAISVQLIGKSGSGKSHLAKHTALSELSAWVPIFVRAGMYEGRLSSLLNRSVAPLTVLTGQHVFAAATAVRSPILLVLDGFNECPAALQDQLVSDLAALFLRQQFILLLTSQTPVPLPPPMATKAISMGALDESHRQAVLASYQAPQITGISEPFQTAYELSLAAECVAELKAPVTRAQLFDAYVRRSLDGLSSPAATRAALRQVALAMDEQLTAALPVDEVWRSAERALAKQPASHTAVDDLFRCKLVRTQQGSFAFSHELIGRFLVGEGLLLDAGTTHELVRQLERPRHADLPELVFPLETRSETLHSVLAGLASTELFLKGLDGELGALAGKVVSREAHAALAAAVTLMDEITLTIKDPESLSPAKLDRDGLSHAECAVLAAAAKLLPEGRFLDEALEIFDATDRALHRTSDAYGQDTGKSLSPSVLAATIIGLHNDPRRRLPATTLIAGCQGARNDYGFRPRTFKPIDAETLTPLIESVDPQSYSRLYFLCLLLETAEHVTVAHLVPTMLRKCWASRAYHLRIQGLRTTQFFCRDATGSVRDEIFALLESFDVRNNIMLSSMLLEVLSSYGLIEPPGSTEGVLNEIHTLLEATPSEEVYRFAYGIYSNQFEDVVAEPYYEAISALSDDERIRFLTLAAQGATETSFFTDTILHQLLQARDPRTLPALTHWTRYPDSQSFFPQESTACYSLAIQGWASLQASPPPQPEPTTDDEAAWLCYGQLIFWLRRPGLDHDQITELCAPVWDQLLGPLSLAAVDPLYQFTHAWSLASPEKSKEKEDDSDSHGLILRTFPGEVRRLLEHLLGQSDKLTSLYNHVDSSALAQYILDILGYVGNEATIGLLSNYVDDARLGSGALRSIKNLRASQ